MHIFINSNFARRGTHTTNNVNLTNSPNAVVNIATPTQPLSHFPCDGTHITNNVNVNNSPNAVVNIGGSTPPPNQPPERTNWMVLAVKALAAIVTAVKVIGPLLGPLLGS